MHKTLIAKFQHYAVTSKCKGHSFDLHIQKYSTSIRRCLQKFSNVRQNESHTTTSSMHKATIRVRVKSLSYLLLKEEQ